jgi:hypothetical protein
VAGIERLSSLSTVNHYCRRFQLNLNAPTSTIANWLEFGMQNKLTLKLRRQGNSSAGGAEEDAQLIDEANANTFIDGHKLSPTSTSSVL